MKHTVSPKIREAILPDPTKDLADIAESLDLKISTVRRAYDYLKEQGEIPMEARPRVNGEVILPRGKKPVRKPREQAVCGNEARCALVLEVNGKRVISIQHCYNSPAIGAKDLARLVNDAAVDALKVAKSYEH